jgi:hypothetical protein
MIYPCRCRACWSRQTLNKDPADYVRRSFALCRNCGADALFVDKYRQLKEHKLTKCYCDAYHFPHRYAPETCFRGKVKG